MRATSTTSWTAGRAGRRGLIGLALALVALLLALPTPAANADPPEVTASVNPVRILHPVQKTKEITLTWRLEPLQLATLTVTESGTPLPVINQPVTSQMGEGTVPLTVAYGKTYIAELINAFGQLGAPLTITTEKANVEMSCAQRCIESVDVQPHGGWAQFTIKTNETAVITVEASTTPPNPSGTWSNPDVVAAFAGTALPTNHYTPPLANLKSNTTYHYVVRAHVKGHEQVKTGTFKTLTRRVDVSFDEIQMIDDSDGPFDGDCDCWFWFGVGDELPKDWGHYDNQHSVASDTTVHPNVKFTVTSVPAEVRLGAIGHDDDNDLGEFCAVGVGRPHPDHPPIEWKKSGDVNNCLEFAGDQIVVPLSRQGPSFAPGDVDEQFTEPLTISVNGELVYKVRGTYKVTYVQ